MKSILQKFYKEKLYIELIVATGLFVFALFTNSMIQFIIHMLYFIIFLEIVRAVANYIREQRVIISLLVDAFIILTLREFIVNVVKINDVSFANFDEVINNSININLMILSGVIVFLFLVRFLAVKTSQRNLLNDRTKID
ncbi:hypothetical protein A9Q76_01160 [Arcobacter sp. 31_11_sub10_T18]|nr:hypothetical protein A9Q76_01160 [Arcobacter sp. 31_11_sub10_T18]